jgi:hypothetical protein
MDILADCVPVSESKARFLLKNAINERFLYRTQCRR